MAHYEKFTAGAVGHMCAHYDRQKNSDGEYVKYGNREIDLDRIHLNYNMHDDARSSMEIYQERISQVKYMKRDDIIMMASCIVTIPSDLEGNQTVEPENERAFFQACYDKLCERHGKENVVSAWVHCDEAGKSHMHFAFVPVIHGKKKRRGKDEYYDVEKICYDEAVTRKEYLSLHPDLIAAVELAEKEKGIYLGSKEVMNGVVAENGRNYTVAQLKKLESLMNDEIIKTREEAQKVLDDMNTAIDHNRQVLNEQAQIASDLTKDIASKETELRGLNVQINGKKNHLDNTIKLAQEQQNRLNSLKKEVEQKEKQLQEMNSLLNMFKTEKEYLDAADHVGKAFKNAAALLETTSEDPVRNLSKIQMILNDLYVAIQATLRGMVGYELRTGKKEEECMSASIRDGFDEYLRTLEARAKAQTKEKNNVPKRGNNLGR